MLLGRNAISLTTKYPFGSFSSAAMALEINEKTWSVSDYTAVPFAIERHYDIRLGRRWNVDLVYVGDNK